MAACTETQHPNHTHKHGPNCGHTPVRHEGHVDYLHDSHLHHMHGDHVDEHVIPVGAANPDRSTPQLKCVHKHGSTCGHEAIPHGEHTDYLVDVHLHHPHGNHCDDHGRAFSWADSVFWMLKLAPQGASPRPQGGASPLQSGACR
jgi:hypothetical protein